MTDRETLAYLKAERARHPELADTLELHIELFEARAELENRNSKTRIRTDDARTRFERGEPLLRTQDLALDWNAFARLFQRVCQIAARYRPMEAEEFAQLGRLFEDEPAHGQEMVREYMANSIHSSLAAFALNNALHPFLSTAARHLQPFVDNALWYGACCPLCHGEPDFAALEKESGARRLLCSRCDTEWIFHRSVCPFCGEDTPGKLGYYPSNDGAYRLYTCENCKRYLKTIDLRELAREVNLPAERVLTMATDVAALSAGYR